jgi:hypothetical protein
MSSRSAIYQNFLVCSTLNRPLIITICSLSELLGVLAGLLFEKSENDDLGFVCQLLGFIPGGQLFGRGTSFLLEPVDDSLEAGSTVF